MPAPQLKGISLDVNSYAFADKTAVKIRTNKASLEAFVGKPLYIVIHKDEKATVLSINFDESNTEQPVILPDSDFFEGVNTIRILDSDLNQLAERLVYKFPASSLNAQISKTNDDNGTVEFSGKINNPNMNLSISVLPLETKSLYDNEDIYSGLLLSPYLAGHQKTNAKKYFNNISRASRYEMDLFLLNQESKYK